MALTVFYHSTDGQEVKNYSTTFYNTTVNLVEGASSTDPASVFQFFLFAAITAYGIRSFFFTPEKSAADLAMEAAEAEPSRDEFAHTISRHVRSGARETNKRK